mmetsp:Transcript_13153/g.35425  ORF Transcript_13153/g.35425 Transcript_13153/m.35425 type:complete len:140 (+) Transcript_13153:79-498(+)
MASERARRDEAATEHDVGKEEVLVLSANAALVCANCGRSAIVDRELYVYQQLAFCGKNCFWSSRLGGPESHLKRRSVRIRSKSTSSAVTQAKDIANVAESSRDASVALTFSLQGTSSIESNAMFDYHSSHVLDQRSCSA